MRCVYYLLSYTDPLFSYSRGFVACYLLLVSLSVLPSTFVSSDKIKLGSGSGVTTFWKRSVQSAY